MNKFLVFLKTVVLVCAAAVCILRFVGFKYESALEPGTLKLFGIISISAAVLLILAGTAWAVIVKKTNER